jgi:1-acyl-sn-glycerol-3-phosphate acyltransferase
MPPSLNRDDLHHNDAGPGRSPAREPARSVVQRTAHALYATYTLSLLAVLMFVAILLALLLPRLDWRRNSTRALARLWLWLSGLRPRISGVERLPAGTCVLVANHSSYLDGVLMKALLPPRFSFVIKREAATMPGLGLLLRRIGSEFVDRESHSGRQRAARKVMKRAVQGHSLVFFPEGTFDSERGLKRFKIGAFVAATRGGVPLVPAVIHGARRAMPNGALAPRRLPLHVEVLDPIESNGMPAALLRDEARRRILARLDEPDLAAIEAAPTPATETDTTHA